MAFIGAHLGQSSRGVSAHTSSRVEQGCSERNGVTCPHTGDLGSRGHSSQVVWGTWDTLELHSAPPVEPPGKYRMPTRPGLPSLTETLSSAEENVSQHSAEGLQPE